MYIKVGVFEVVWSIVFCYSGVRVYGYSLKDTNADHNQIQHVQITEDAFTLADSKDIRISTNTSLRFRPQVIVNKPIHTTTALPVTLTSTTSPTTSSTLSTSVIGRASASSISSKSSLTPSPPEITVNHKQSSVTHDPVTNHRKITKYSIQTPGLATKNPGSPNSTQSTTPTRASSPAKTVQVSSTTAITPTGPSSAQASSTAATTPKSKSTASSISSNTSLSHVPTQGRFDITTETLPMTTHPNSTSIPLPTNVSPKHSNGPPLATAVSALLLSLSVVFVVVVAVLLVLYIIKKRKNSYIPCTLRSCKSWISQRSRAASTGSQGPLTMEDPATFAAPEPKTERDLFSIGDQDGGDDGRPGTRSRCGTEDDYFYDEIFERSAFVDERTNKVNKHLTIGSEDDEDDELDIPDLVFKKPGKY